MKVKYIRWSTLAQTGSRQLMDNKDYDQIFQEQISGSIAFAKRPQGLAVLKLIQSGKITDLFVEEFSRLGRNSLDTLTTLKICEDYNVNVHIQNMNLESIVDGKPNSIFKLFSHIVSVIAEQERELIKERTEMGKLAARQRGVTFGRKVGSNERKIDFLNKETNKLILRYLTEGKTTIREIAKITDASTATIMKVKKVAVETRQIAIIE
ncbi:MAG: recombinase family protein [Chitinophagaceae bacterium]|jgi:DNA invertase Pin-like site-specific DNA recombinase